MIAITFPEDGGAVIEVTGANMSAPTLRLRDRHTLKYLGSAGWSRVSVFLPCDVSQDVGKLRLRLQPEVASELLDGMQLSLEEPALDFRENFAWQAPKATPPDVPAPATGTAETAEALTPTPLSQAHDPNPKALAIAENTERPASPEPAFVAPSKRLWTTAASLGLSALLLVASGALYVQLRDVSRERDGLAAQKAALDQKITDISNETAALKRSFETAKSQAAADLSSQNSDFQTKLAKLTDELAQVSRERNDLVASKAQLSQVGSDATTELTAAQKTISDLTQENGRLRTKSLMLESTNQDLAKRVNALISKPENRHADKLYTLQAENQDLKSQLDNKFNALTAAKMDLQTYKAKVDQLLSRSSTPSSNSMDTGELDRLRAENLNLNNQLRDQSSKISTFDAQLTDMQGKLALAEQQKNAYPRARWLAAAVDKKGSVQAITNQTSADAAEKVAMKLCEGAAGGCRLIGSYESSCFSLSRRDGAGVTRDNWGFGVAGSWREAEEKAVRDCIDVTGLYCTIRYTVCSPDTLDKPQ